MKLKVKVLLTVLMVLTLMTSGTAFAATSMSPSGNPTSFDLNSIAEENDNKLWIKVSTVWDPKLSMYDATSLPAGTLAIAVKFKITNFDQGSSLMYWVGSLTGNGMPSDVWDNTMPTDQMTVDSDGTYMMVFDAQKVFEGTLDGINSLQMVLECNSVDDAANTKTHFSCLSVEAITDASELDQYATGKIGGNDTSAVEASDVSSDASTTVDTATADADSSIPKTGENTSLPITYVLLALTAVSLGTITIIVEKKKNCIK